jgi:D-beta-D-heptose 7-phosphate kinase/D-beta-D-heptose 1-phosphate adenosyltransferase
VSDYGKGFFNSLERLPASTIKKSIVDPFGSNWDKYKGCFILKPNIAELENFIGGRVSREELATSAKKVMETISPECLVVTLGAEGVMWTLDGLKLNFYKGQAKSVADVSGAGDTFAAYLASELSFGETLEAAIKVAVKASSLAVERIGTSIVHKTELQLNNKLLAPVDLEEQISLLKVREKKIVFTNGCFDVIHAGHISLFSAAKKMGDVLIVGVNSDSSVNRLKGIGRPINSLGDRISVLSAIQDIDFIVVFGDERENLDSPIRIIESILPDVLVKGGDYSQEDIVGAKLVNAYGGNVYIHETIKGLSTTAILNKGNL